MSQDELDVLPAYSSSIALQGQLECKHEFSRPLREAFIRSWSKVKLDLNNTQLRIVYFSRVRTLSLQFALVGIVPDYPKVPYAFRLRAEGEQFLFSCTSLKELLQWLQALQMSIGIALPIDLRGSDEEIYRANTRCRRARSFSSTHSHSSESSTDSKKQPKAVVSGRHALANTKTKTHLNGVPLCDAWSSLINEDDMSELDISVLYNFSAIPRDLTWDRTLTLYKGRWSLVRGNSIYECISC